MCEWNQRCGTRHSGTSDGCCADASEMENAAMDAKSAFISQRPAHRGAKAEASPGAVGHAEEERAKDEAAFARWLLAHVTERDSDGGDGGGYIW